MSATPVRDPIQFMVPQPVEFFVAPCLSANVLEGAVLVQAPNNDDSVQLPAGPDVATGIVGIAALPGAPNATGTMNVITGGPYELIANGTITRGQWVTVASAIGDVKAVGPTTHPGAELVGFALESATNGQRVRCVIEIGGSYAGQIAVNRQVRCVASSNVNLSTGLVAGQTIDGVTLLAGDRVLLAAQSTAAQNGVYVATASGPAAFALDYVTGSVLAGMVFEASEGTAWANSSWKITAAQVSVGGIITIGTTDPILMPRMFQATVAVGTPNTAAWVSATTSPVAMNDTTGANAVKAVLVAGRGNGSITLTGTGTDSIRIAVFNW